MSESGLVLGGPVSEAPSEWGEQFLVELASVFNDADMRRRCLAKFYAAAHDAGYYAGCRMTASKLRLATHSQRESLAAVSKRIDEIMEQE